MPSVTCIVFGMLVPVATTIASASFIGTAAAQDLFTKRYTTQVQQRLRKYFIIK